MSEIEQTKNRIDKYIDMISEKHRLHRKIKFLLDVRGLLVINRMKGDYVEFGVFRGEMMYAASNVLGEHIDRFIGLDTFSGLPKPTKRDTDIFVYESEGFMASPREAAAALLAEHETLFIEGDFRSEDIQADFKKAKPKIAVVTIDCNWPSSVEAALHMSGPSLQCGSLVYIDDYFVGTREPNFNDPILDEVAKLHNLRFNPFMTYPPCGRGFVVELAQPAERAPVTTA